MSTAFYFVLPDPLFSDPVSMVILSRDGHLLGARIAKDEQWRFPEIDKIPTKYEKALLCFEDRYFYNHPGVNPIALLRAFKQNIKSGRIVSGGSTISMQLVRISRKGKSRSLYQKMIEMIMAVRLELRYSKKEILNLYASHAPFGGNIVGLQAASWRYFGRKADQLSWSEAATLAVLPNAPSLIYPGHNNRRLYEKRNRLLERLYHQEVIDSMTCELSKLEEIPRKIHKLPSLAPHLLNRINKKHSGKIVKTTIDAKLQAKVKDIISRHQTQLEANQIHNAAAIVLDVETGEALAYVGNTSQKGKEEHGNQVDVIISPRSTGSILKPLLYAAMLYEGEILPNTLVPDIPTQIAGYSPKNYSLTYDGAVPAHKALSRSLNVPSIHMLRDFGVEKFHHLLKKLKLKTINRPSDHYGLTLILGGAEGTLWDLTGIYASLARTLNHYNNNDGVYSSSDIRPPTYEKYVPQKNNGSNGSSLLNAASIYQTFKALLEVNRPESESGWKNFSSSKRVAWKTGTSFGFRDGWAIGVTPRYVTGVWVGNADGEGRAGLTGVGAAAPILFDIFNLLPTSTWFTPPYEEMVKIPVCKNSGYRAGRWCTADTIQTARAGLKTKVCPYHHLIHLDATECYRVNSDCEDVNKMIHKPWFTLPPVIEWFYKKQNPFYSALPPVREDCRNGLDFNPMEFIYPRENTQIFIPVELNGKHGKSVFEIAHKSLDATVFWHLDDEYLGSTNHIHQMELSPSEGKHLLTLIDEAGNTIHKKFTIVGISTPLNHH